MTALQIFAAGLAHVVQPGPHLGYDGRVQAELDARDRAAQGRATAARGTRDWLAADTRVRGAEARLARLLDVTPPPPPQLVLDDPWLTSLYAQYAAACATTTA